MKILVCEDDYMMTKAIGYKLSKDGYEVDLASDGNQASEKIRSNSYDIIITDLLMPYVGGLELINKIRNEMSLNTPIIVLSQLGNEETVLQAFKLGADDYVTKPFSPNELSIRVKKLLIKR